MASWNIEPQRLMSNHQWKDFLALSLWSSLIRSALVLGFVGGMKIDYIFENGTLSRFVAAIIGSTDFPHIAHWQSQWCKSHSSGYSKWTVGAGTGPLSGKFESSWEPSYWKMILSFMVVNTWYQFKTQCAVKLRRPPIWVSCIWFINPVHFLRIGCYSIIMFLPFLFCTHNSVV